MIVSDELFQMGITDDIVIPFILQQTEYEKYGDRFYNRVYEVIEFTKICRSTFHKNFLIAYECRKQLIGDGDIWISGGVIHPDKIISKIRNDKLNKLFK